MEQNTPQNTNDNAEIPVISVPDSGGGAGRPTKRNEETVARICDALAEGMPLKSACAVANVGVAFWTALVRRP